jgi:hypothetical protein
VFGQSSLFNDNAFKNSRSIYIKWQQMKTEWGVSRLEREKESRGSMECETAHWTEIEMVWVGNGR